MVNLMGTPMWRFGILDLLVGPIMLVLAAVAVVGVECWFSSAF